MFLRNTLLVCFTAVVLASAFAVPSNAVAMAPAQAAAGLNGRVTDVQGGVVPNAQVSLVKVVPTMPGMVMTQPPPLAGQMNADGTFAFTQIPPGQYLLQADAPGFSRSSAVISDLLVMG